MAMPLAGTVSAAESKTPPSTLSWELSDLNLTGLEQLQPPRWGRDPFALPTKDEVLAGSLTLTAILYHPQSKMAIVNGRMVRVGDQIEGRQVVSIGPDHIVVREGRVTRRLEVAKFTMEAPRR
jgi:hypothetical protein